MKRVLYLALALIMCASTLLAISSCDSKADYTVGICQYMEHESLEKATNGFMDALTEEMEKAGKTVKFENQNAAGETQTCNTIVDSFVAKDVDLILANATPALTAASNATTDIPILGTSVTDYEDTFSGKIPANVSGTSDAVPFDEQANMMIETLGLVAGDKVGVIYCLNESNSKIQYDEVKKFFEANGIIVEAYTFSEITEIQTIATKAASDCRAIYVPSDNTVADNDSIVGTVCTEKNVPVFTSYGGEICYASLAIDYYELGRETGKMAAKILLENKSISEIEVATLTPTKVYNEELCKTLGIEIPAK